MRISANVNEEVYEYFKDCDFDLLVDLLLDSYDHTNLPPMTGKRYKELLINVTDPYYLEYYKKVGPRSPHVSLGRLLESAYDNKVLSVPKFQQTIREQSDTSDPSPLSDVISLVNRAVNLIVKMRRIDPEATELLEIIELLEQYIKRKEV